MWEDGEFIEDECVTFDKTAFFAKKFDEANYIYDGAVLDPEGLVAKARKERANEEKIN